MRNELDFLEVFYKDFLQHSECCDLGLHLDHFAIIDLPTCYSGRHYLAQVFEKYGYSIAGEDRIESRQNPFLWMRHHSYNQAKADAVPPQIVLADFDIDMMPDHINTILSDLALDHDIWKKEGEITSDLIKYPAWRKPTVAQYNVLVEYNELLAWVAAIGRRINHFAYSVHLLGSREFDPIKNSNYIDKKIANHDRQKYKDQQLGGFARYDLDNSNNNNQASSRRLESFMLKNFDESKLNMQGGGLIKGSCAIGIEQASTLGIKRKVELSDGFIEVRMPFQEFVFRYPNNDLINKNTSPYNILNFNEYYADFIPANATEVIKSLAEVD